MAAYWPSKSNNGHLSVIQQHWRHFATQDPNHTNQPNPQQQFWNDLQPLLTTSIEAGEQIVVGIDANDYVRHPDITAFFNEVGMMEAILHRHSPDAPPMHQCRPQAIDGLFVTPGLVRHLCSYLGGLEGVTGNHQGLWMDLPEEWLLGGSMPAIVWAGARQLKSDDPRM